MRPQTVLLPKGTQWMFAPPGPKTPPEIDSDSEDEREPETYYDGDRARVCHEQPIRAALPDYLKTCTPTPHGLLRPPTLRYGWRLGGRRMFDVVQRHYPDVVVTCLGLEEHLSADKSIVDYPVEFHPGSKTGTFPSILDTLIANYDLEEKLYELMNLERGTDESKLLYIGEFADEHGKRAFGLAYGANLGNTTTMIPEEKVQSLIQLFGLQNEKPVWYLDQRHWRWTYAQTWLHVH
ncbi:hypothetical protein PENSPDRAFT_333610 [Peniophora sp. CONT]|nr:hypothetical protein PENSPDRAFT_333610 [Peniophora sp. CONT]